MRRGSSGAARTCRRPLFNVEDEVLSANTILPNGRDLISIRSTAAMIGLGLRMAVQIVAQIEPPMAPRHRRLRLTHRQPANHSLTWLAAEEDRGTPVRKRASPPWRVFARQARTAGGGGERVEAASLSSVWATAARPPVAAGGRGGASSVRGQARARRGTRVVAVAGGDAGS